MSTGLIIAIVVVALILLALLFFIPRMKRQAELKKRERELHHRRETVATEHREVAGTREREAEQAERQARMAQKEAERQRAEAELHQERAAMHEQGEADHELIDEHERDRFAGTSAMQGGTDNGTTREVEGGRAHEPAGTADGTTGSQSEFEQGREVGHEEAEGGRFQRDERTTDQPGSRRA